MNETTIYRPNHGLAHTYRVMLGIELVIQYFAHYALDPEFRMFCQQLSPKDIEWLRVAAAFSVSGRESEASAKNSLELAESYRQKSAEYFSQYVNKNSFFNDKDMRERITSIVRFMGNPYYENQLNDHPDKKERTLRNFYFRILTIAHKLDLVRCYAPSQYMEAMKVCGEWSVNSDAQSKAYKEMIQYFIDLNKAHGDTVFCDLDVHGQFAPEFQSYKPIFAEVSLSMKRAREVAETVAKPRILFQPMSIENRV
jgi:hypothetical protein